MAETSFTFLGGTHAIGNIEKEGERFYADAGDGLYEVGGVIIKRAQGLVPVLTGELRDTGAVDKPVVNARETSVTLHFGGGGVDYAVAVHEDLQAVHTNGQAKFLERAIFESAPSILGWLANRVKR